ncbi:MAG: VOC family protein [Woeseiaceae bacterium]|nr:VOC family protein [Woeseiaceae bacterium]
MTSRRILLLALLALTSPTFAQQADVTFFVIGKHANYDQAESSATPRAFDYSFFSEIFLTADGDASAAVLTLPDGEALSYRDMRRADGGARDNLLLVSGEARYEHFDALQARYPDGDYGVRFATPSGNVDATLTFQRRPLPAAPVVTVTQNGLECDVFAADTDLEVRWQPFAAGRADPNGILDDLIFVILENEDGVRVSHSGRPFEDRPYLTYADDRQRIDGGVLQSGSIYRLSVEHALLDDTTSFDGVPAFTTRAVTTRLPIAVGAKAAGCAPPADTLQSQITMFYYEDLDAASRFYGEVLGLEKTFDWEWVRFYRTGPASSVGIVREGSGAWHRAKPDNAVMLSLVTSDVDAWYRRATQHDVVILKDIGDGGGIRSFLLEDPGGYTVEFFEWLEARQ